MSASIEPRSGLYHSWGFGEHNWNTGMDANLLRLGRFGFHLSAKSRVSEPPLSPADGDTYIVASGVNDWAGLDGRVMVWDASGSTWVDAVPRIGWVCYVEDEEKLCAFKATGWSAGVSL